MGRKVDVDQLVGTREIAARLGFRHAQSVHHLRRTDSTFPDTVFGEDGTPSAMVWYWPDIARWARRKGRSVLLPSTDSQRLESTPGRRKA